MIGSLVGWLVGWLLGCLVAWLLGCLVALLLCCLVAWLLACLKLKPKLDVFELVSGVGDVRRLALVTQKPEYAVYGLGVQGLGFSAFWLQ